MMGLPTVTGNTVIDAMFYGGIAFLLLLFVGPFVWHAVDRYRFRHEHDEADKTIAAARFAADADLSKVSLSERRSPVGNPTAAAAVLQAKAYVAAKSSAKPVTEFERITGRKGGAR